MAGRIRSIKPEILEDEEAAALSSDAWRLWISLWTLADDFGNLHAAPAKLKGQVFWGYEPAKPVDALLQELIDMRRIDVYEVNGSRFAHIRNWEKHQRIDNAGKSRAPKPGEGTLVKEVRGESPRTAANLGEPPPSAAIASAKFREIPLDPDHRPPTTDHRSAPDSSNPVQPEFGLESEKPKAKPGKPDSVKLTEYFCQRWVETQRPEDGKPPSISEADRGQASQLVKRHGLDVCKDYVDRYLADDDPWLSKTAYALKNLPGRIDTYRTARTGKRKGIEPPIPHSDETVEVKF